MKLSMQDVRNFRVPEGSLSVWWLGQASFIVKSGEPSNLIAAIDPYLSNACKALGERAGLNLDRITEPPLSPQDLVGIDLCLLTHSHEDHCDPKTLKPYREAGGRAPFVAPPETAEKLREVGVPESEIIMIWPNKTHKVGNLTFRATFAVPPSGSDLTHVGYLISLDGGPTFYFTGDSSYHDILAISVAEHKPDVMFAVINGAFRNMGPADAALLASQINPKLVIPYHYDLFPDSLVPPNLLRTNLAMFRMKDRFKVLEHCKPFTFPEAKG